MTAALARKLDRARDYLKLVPKVKYCYLDFETFSEADLKAVGAWLYAEHPTTGINCIGFWDSEKPLPRLVQRDFRQIDQLKELMTMALDPSYKFVAHNAGFEQAIWKAIMVKRYGLPELPIDRWIDTMALAYRHGLPGSLKYAAKLLNLPELKDEEGQKTMLRLAKPRRASKANPDRFWTPATKAKEFALLYKYCTQDIRTTKALHEALPDLSKKERRIWEIDQRINQQGLYVDLELCHKAKELYDIETEKMLKEFRGLTGGIGPKQRVKMLDWFKKQGYDVPNTKKTTLSTLLHRKDLDETVERVITLMELSNKTSNSKYTAAINRSRGDGLVREIAAYFGAHTGRWAARGIQLHNLPRPAFSSDLVVKTIKNYDHTTFRFCYEDVTKALSIALRGMIIPKPGQRLFVADFSQMENRIVAWLSGAEWKLELFRRGVDPYKLIAATIYGVDVENVTDDQRFVGKVAELSLQYCGGINAFAKMCKAYGLDLTPVYWTLIKNATERELESAEFCYLLYLKSHEQSGELEKPVSQEVAYAANIIKDRWRRAHPEIAGNREEEIAGYWNDLEAAAVDAVLTRQRQTVNAGRSEVVFFMAKVGKINALACRLPSGRNIFYPLPKVAITKRGKRTLSYWNKEKKRTTTYGGKLCENITQAVQRDLLVDAMIRLEEKYPVMLHVHDELISSVELGNFDHQEFEDLMKAAEPWTDGIPIDAKGFECLRYRKAA